MFFKSLIATLVALLSVWLQACVPATPMPVAPVTTHSQTMPPPADGNGQALYSPPTVKATEPELPMQSGALPPAFGQPVVPQRQQPADDKQEAETRLTRPLAPRVAVQQPRRPPITAKAENYRFAPKIAKGRQYHTVRDGETLYSIGARSGYGFQQLALINKLSAPYPVEVGQKIKLFNNSHKNNYIDEKNNERNLQKSLRINGKRSKSTQKNLDGYSSGNSEKKPSVNTPAQYQPLKKASISIDNKKMLKLAFDWPLKGRVVKNFQQSKNKGIDIAGKVGQRVLAAEDGKVIYGGPWLVGFGSLLIIKHTPAYLSAYANNSQLLVKEGQTVHKGQVVAQVGRTPSRKAALHFEIRKNGKSINPLRLLPSL